jgi:hypothetical protein
VACLSENKLVHLVDLLCYSVLDPEQKPCRHELDWFALDGWNSGYFCYK